MLIYWRLRNWIQLNFRWRKLLVVPLVFIFGEIGRTTPTLKLPRYKGRYGPLDNRSRDLWWPSTRFSWRTSDVAKRTDRGQTCTDILVQSLSERLLISCNSVSPEISKETGILTWWYNKPLGYWILSLRLLCPRQRLLYMLWACIFLRAISSNRSAQISSTIS